MNIITGCYTCFNLNSFIKSNCCKMKLDGDLSIWEKVTLSGKAAANPGHGLGLTADLENTGF